MKRLFLTLISLVFCSFLAKAENKKKQLIIIYDEYCSYSQELINNTLSDTTVEQTIAENFEYKLIEQNLEEAQEFIKKYNIEGFPTQILTQNNEVTLAYGFLSKDEQLRYLNTVSDFKQEQNQQEYTIYEEFVFLKSGLGYDHIEKKLLVPGKDKVYNNCTRDDDPLYYYCAGINSSDTYIDNTNLDKGNFTVSVFFNEEDERPDSKGFVTTSSVKNGKVVKQTRCYYGNGHRSYDNSRKSHFFMKEMECYTVTPKLCGLLTNVKDMEEFKSVETFDKFKDILSSEDYQEASLSDHTYNFRKIFIHANNRKYYKYYSKLKHGFYNKKDHGEIEALKPLRFEKTQLVQNAKNLFEIFKKENKLMGDVFYRPCKNLSKANLLPN